MVSDELKSTVVPIVAGPACTVAVSLKPTNNSGIYSASNTQKPTLDDTQGNEQSPGVEQVSRTS
jgi:hypothetical protein